MEEIIEQLTSFAEHVPVPLEKADFNDIVEAEEIILMPLSKDFKTFLLECSHITFGRYEPVAVSDPNSHTYLPEVASYAWSIGLPRELVPICQIGDDFFVVREDGEVQYFGDGKLVSPQWPSIWHWVDEIWLRDCAFNTHD